MQADLRNTVGKVVGSAGRLASTSDELNSLTESTSLGLRQQSNELDQAAAAVTQLMKAIEEVARNAASASDFSLEVDRRSHQGQENVTRTVGAIKVLASDIERTSKAFQTFAGRVASIGSVLDVIRGIAEQTNLLALNAAIEAARAGDSGRGFAVIADEVRALAQRTQESTKQISRIIDVVQQGGSCPRKWCNCHGSGSRVSGAQLITADSRAV